MRILFVFTIIRALSYRIKVSWLFCTSLLSRVWRQSLATPAPAPTPPNKRPVHVDPNARKFIDKTVNQSVLDSFPRRPTAGDFEAALIECHTASPGTCVHLLKTYARPYSVHSNNDLILSPTSLAIGWSVSQREVRLPEYLHTLNTHYVGPPISDEAATLHYTLDYHYKKLLSTPKISYPDSGCMMRCGVHGNALMVRALLQVEPTLASQFLEQGAAAEARDVITLIAEEYRGSLQSKDIQDALKEAVWSALYPSVDLLVEVFGPDITQAMYENIFNDMCEYDVPEGLELMLDRFRDRLQFEDGFTFIPRFVKKRKGIVSLLYATYGSKLVEQFPDWNIKA